MRARLRLAPLLLALLPACASNAPAAEPSASTADPRATEPLTLTFEGWRVESKQSALGRFELTNRSDEVFFLTGYAPELPFYGCEPLDPVFDRLRELGWCGNGASGHPLAPGEVWTFEVWAGEISPPFRLELNAWRAQSEQPLVVRSDPIQNPVFRRDTALELLGMFDRDV